MGQIEMAVRRALSPAEGETLLIAVSGGVDSLVLLHAALTVRRRLGITIVTATLDHGLRGADSAADAEYVVRLSETWGVSCLRGSLPPGALDSTGVGLEAAARAARYAFLAEAARSTGARQVAVGHHADDQAETVLAHLVRGAGLDGLAGMRERAPLPGHADLTLLRPLLSVRRAAIVAYADRHAIVPRHDATNEDTQITRNRIRHDLIPLMASINAGVVDALVRLADNAAQDVAYLDGAVDAALANPALILLAAPDQIVVQRAELLALHPALVRRILMRLTSRLIDPARGESLSHERLSALITHLYTGKTGQIDVVGPVRARFTHEKFGLYQAQA